MVYAAGLPPPHDGHRSAADRPAGASGLPHPPAEEAIVLTAFRRTVVIVALAGAVLAPAANADPHFSDPRYTASFESNQDLRSPDARDAAAGRGTWNSPDVTVVKLEEPASPVAERGIDWADAGIGAGTVFGLVVVGLAGTMAVVHRRRTAPVA
jgi:hypothetical protein